MEGGRAAAVEKGGGGGLTPRGWGESDFRSHQRGRAEALGQPQPGQRPEPWRARSPLSRELSTGGAKPRLYPQGGKEPAGSTSLLLLNVFTACVGYRQPRCLLSAVGQFPFFAWGWLWFRGFCCCCCWLVWFFLIGNGDCKTIETDMGSGVLGQFLHHRRF